MKDLRKMKGKRNGIGVKKRKRNNETTAKETTVKRPLIFNAPSGGRHSSWVPGDLVKLLHDEVWLDAEVVEDEGGDWYVVRVVESPKEMRVHASFICGSSEKKLNYEEYLDAEADKFPATTNCERRSFEIKDANNDKNLNGHPRKKVKPAALQMKKRKGVPRLSGVEPAGVHNQNMFQKMGPLLPGTSLEVLEKVDAVASPHIMLGDKYMHYPVREKRTVKKPERVADRRCLYTKVIDYDEANSYDCSVASSSGSYSQYINCRNTKGNEIRESCPDDRESCSDEPSWVLRCRNQSRSRSNEQLAAEIHKLELRAYRCTLEAFYASGVLSWEQEALITNLRLNLHISNDEHLLELRHLVHGEMW